MIDPHAVFAGTVGLVFAVAMFDIGIAFLAGSMRASAGGTRDDW